MFAGNAEDFFESPREMKWVFKSKLESDLFDKHIRPMKTLGSGRHF